MAVIPYLKAIQKRPEHPRQQVPRLTETQPTRRSSMADLNVSTSEEVWKSVSGYEGLYEISNQGSVRSVKRRDRLNRSKGGH